MKFLENLGKHTHIYQLILISEENVSADWSRQKFIEAFNKLNAIVQPLSITFAMAYCAVDFPLLNLNIVPPKPTWHIREAILPPNVEVYARFQQKEHEEIIVDKISSQTLDHYLKQAYDQPIQNNYLPTLHMVEMFYTRARIFDASSDNVTLRYYSENYMLPVESRYDGHWVSGPLKDTFTNPPIKVEFLNNNGRLELTIVVGWSLWLDSDTQEMLVLQKLLQEIESCGWISEKL